VGGLREVVVRYVAVGGEGDARVVGRDRLRPTESEWQRMGRVRDLKIRLGGRIKVEAHGGTQAREVLLHPLKLERMANR